jgi:endoribonuclease Dicer
MANIQPTIDSTKQEETDIFSSIELTTIKTNSKEKLIHAKSNYLTNVQIEEPTQIIHQSPISSVIHFEPTPIIKRLLNIEEVIHDDDEIEHSSLSLIKPSISSKTNFHPLENGHDSGIIDDFSEPLNINLDFEYLPESHPGPSPALLLQALTLSNAGDGFDLERLETVGDSFLKQAVTVYIYCTYTQVHEGKLSFFRSKIVSNYNLYKLGKRKSLGEYLISTKFEPFENWIPPLFTSGSPTEYGLLSSSGVELWTKSESTTNVDWIELQERREQRRLAKNNLQSSPTVPLSSVTMLNNQATPIFPTTTSINEQQWTPSYDRRTQHLISDKSIADAVEALIGAYLIASGPKAALRFMAWLGIRIFPKLRLEDGTEMTGELPPLPSPVDYSNPSVLTTIQSYDFDRFEQLIGYRFHQRAYLIQAFTHASYSYNTITDCYQRLEFLGDAVLDYVITRYLYEVS